MNQTELETKGRGAQQHPGCNVSMAFNFAAGGIAIAAALLICYLAYRYL